MGARKRRADTVRANDLTDQENIALCGIAYGMKYEEHSHLIPSLIERGYVETVHRLTTKGQEATGLVPNGE